MVSAGDTIPYVQAAFFCERVLREADGVLSAIRIVDRITASASGGETPDEMPPLSYRLFVYVALVPGKVRGRHSVRLDMETPDGELRMMSSNDMLFEADDRPVAAVTEMQAVFTQEGLHWLVVSFDGNRLTRSPLRVIYQRLQTGGGAPPTPASQ